MTTPRPGPERAHGTPAARHPHPHESAHLHVSGEAIYVDDLPELARTAHAALGLSPRRTPASSGSTLTRCVRCPA